MLLALFVAAAPVAAPEATALDAALVGEHHFLFLLGGHPAGQVMLKLERGGRFTYRSQHWHRRDEHVAVTTREKTHLLAELLEGLRPEGLVLLSPPKEGRQTVVEDLHGDELILEVAQSNAGFASGRMGADVFQASYRGGLLERLDLAEVSFIRVEGEQRPRQTKDRFGGGVPVSGSSGELRLVVGQVDAGTVALLPVEEETARRVMQSVHEQFTSKRTSRADLIEDPGAREGSCLAHVRAALAGLAKSKSKGMGAVVHGFVAEEGDSRAYPHVWVRVRTERGLVDLDPTLMLAVTARTHLPLAVRATLTAEPSVGQRYLEVFRGPGLQRSR